MELQVIDKQENDLQIEIAGENHTFMNVLKSALLETEGVDAATYDVNPEQSGGQTEPILSIKTEDGTDPLDALEAAARRVDEQTASFKDTFNAAI